MKIVVAVSFFVIFVVACKAESYNGEALYSRSDCIVKFHIDTSGLNREEIQGNHDAFSTFIATESVYPVAGISFPNRSRSFHYVQFSDSCDKKLEITNTMVTHFLSDRGLNLDYQVFPDTVCPSPKTINIQGSTWSPNETCQ